MPFSSCFFSLALCCRCITVVVVVVAATTFSFGNETHEVFWYVRTVATAASAACFIVLVVGLDWFGLVCCYFFPLLLFISTLHKL